MKNFIEKLKNFGGVIKFLLFLSDALKGVADAYEKHYPQAQEKKNVVNENNNPNK